MVLNDVSLEACNVVYPTSFPSFYGVGVSNFDRSNLQGSKLSVSGFSE